MDAQPRAQQPPQQQRSGGKTERKSQEPDAYMDMLREIFTEKRKMNMGESSLMSHEQQAIANMTTYSRKYALAYGVGAGSVVAGMVNVLNKPAYRSRFRFWMWVAPSAAWGALSGLQVGAKVSTVELLNLPDS